MKKLKILLPIILFVIIFSAGLNAQENDKNNEVFFIVEEMPEYPGGEEALRKDLAEFVKYPDQAKKDNISGKVYVTFVVNEEGKVQNAKIARGVNPYLDKEALRAINLLKTWTPGKQKGKAVKVSYTVPINFALNNQNKNKSTENKKIVNDKEVFKIVEEMPEFPGGQDALRDFIAKNVKYPEQAKKEKVSGKVYVTFIVSKDGSVNDSKIARGVHPTLDKEALRVINILPKWKPGKQRGENVNVQYTVPISFALD